MAELEDALPGAMMCSLQDQLRRIDGRGPWRPDQELVASAQGSRIKLLHRCT
jgi:hypothetical protein